MSQDVYENLPLSQLRDHFGDIFSSAYSVSLFTDWKRPVFHQVWLKRKLADAASSAPAAPEFYGAVRADGPRHPVQGHSPESCNDQQGLPGPWYDRLAHFRMDFTPSAGEELQSEYYVAREDAYAALCAIGGLRESIAPLLHVSEIRTIAGDELWMSPCYRRHSVGIHFTWKKDWDGVRNVLPLIERELAPFRARPHWAKLFAMPAERLQPLYEKLPDFRKLLRRYDPERKFRNDFLQQYIDY